MFASTLALSVLVSASVVIASNDPNTALTKPPLVDGLSYLNAGLGKNLPQTSYTLDQWAYGTIPQGCKDVAQGKVESSINYDPHDFEIYNVQYSDCGDPWVFCHHKDSNVTIDSMAGQFGKLPVQMRQWISHVIDVPAENGWAFEENGMITFVRPVDDMLTAIVHETGHSLDLSGAYADHPLSSSDNWWNAYNQDSNVPDGYSQTNAKEDIAQNTVVALFDQNYPGGYGAIQPNATNISHQYHTIVNEANAAGVGNSLLAPGEGGSCIHHMPATKAVSMDDSSSKRMVTRRSSGSRSGCSLTW